MFYMGAFIILQIAHVTYRKQNKYSMMPPKRVVIYSVTHKKQNHNML